MLRREGSSASPFSGRLQLDAGVRIPHGVPARRIPDHCQPVRLRLAYQLATSPAELALLIPDHLDLVIGSDHGEILLGVSVVEIPVPVPIEFV